ncbi:hypothetical protein ElyMa_004047000 [Elysia marginata]|uniref:Uncharacterized protein n=1 Tax=Elysia marginata TaxID=1093978 RepID=A0AAV4G4P9_9GAST|nr:hypothetical protein ElyMa_004047000 [Elysia marginata]
MYCQWCSYLALCPDSYLYLTDSYPRAPLIVETLHADDDNVDVKTPIGNVGYTADDWLTGPVIPSAILDFPRYGLRPPERARNA